MEMRGSARYVVQKCWPTLLRCKETRDFIAARLSPMLTASRLFTHLMCNFHPDSGGFKPIP